MKGIILLFAAAFWLNQDPGFYDITIQKADGSYVQMSAFSGKKIMIVAYNPGNSDYSQLQLLNSLQKSQNRSLIIIAVPAIDLSDSAGIALSNKQSDSSYSFLITKPMMVRKSAGNNQGLLFQWLTKVKGNTHFDRDVDQEGETFYINEKGMLYGVMDRQTTNADILSVLN